MKYWLTTHWPPSEGDTKSDDYGVYVPNGRQEAGKEIRPGNKVLIYESQSGRTEIRTDVDDNIKYVPCIRGRRGIVYISEALTSLKNYPKTKMSKYTDGSEILWSWYADTKLLRDTGFVPAEKVNEVLGYKKNYNFHGFGTKKSGLKEISEAQYNELVEIYKAGDKRKSDIPQRFFPDGITSQGGGESSTHKALKKYIAHDPSSALEVPGLKTVRMEYPYPTGDRADILLNDFEGRLIAVEVEIEIEQDTDIIGLLQALKYKAMIAPMFRRSNSEVLAFLVAYKISPHVKELCEKYDVKYFIIDRKKVEARLQGS